MTKTELIDHIADAADLSKAAANRALDATLDAITQSLTEGEGTTLAGFGTFLVRERAPRKGRNPQTGEEIAIAASKTAAFKPAKGLKDALN